MKLGKAAKNILIFGAATVLLVLVLAWMSGAFNDTVEPGKVEAPARLAGDIATDRIHQITRTETVEVVGTVRAEDRVDVAPRLMAAVVQLAVRAGDHVKEGEVVARLDDRDVKAQYQQASQGVAEAKAAQQNAKEEFDRTKKAYEQQAVSEQAFDRTQAQLRMAQAKLQQALEAESAAKTMLSYTEIKAPVGGVVVDRLANSGDMAAPGRALLSIYVPTTLRLEAPVPEALASRVSVGDPISLSIDSLNSGTVTGKVQEIVPQAQEASRSVLVKVGLPKDLPGLVEGAAGRLFIPAADRARLCVPQSAVRSVGQLRFIDVVKEADGKKVLERRQVKLGETKRLGRQEILSGADAGETVALYGPPPPPLPESGDPFAPDSAPAPKAGGAR